MKKATQLLLSLCCGVFFAQGQEVKKGICGMSSEDQLPVIERLDRNQANPTARERGAIRYVPVHFHAVGDADAAGRLREVKILEQLCDLNASYLPHEIQFYLSPHPTIGTLFDYTIANANVYETQTNTFLMQNKRHAKAANIYIVKDAVSGNTPLPGTQILAYYNPSFDWIVSRKDQINGSGNGTLAHELGHMWSLPHTFFGWESNPFGPGDFGWPKAPATSPNGFTPTEKQDASNSNVAGDKIADTPPDYNFGIELSGCANYTGGAKDPANVLVDPMENNFMSYFSNCNYEFTPKQAAAMHNDLNQSDRNYLDNNFTPPAAAISTPADMLVGPLSGAITPFYDLVELNWNAVQNATYYLLELDVTSQFATGNYQAHVLNNVSTHQLTNLKKNQQYYWRIKPFNEVDACAAARTGSFKTGESSVTGTIDIKAVQDWKVQPNPAQGVSEVQVAVEATESFEAFVSVSDASGKVVFSGENRNFAAGETRVNIPVFNLADGVYFVSLTSADAKMTKRLVVLQ